MPSAAITHEDLRARLNQPAVDHGRPGWTREDFTLHVKVHLACSGPHTHLCPPGPLVQVTNFDLIKEGRPHVTLASHRSDTGRARVGVIHPEHDQPTRLEQLIRADVGPNPGLIKIEVRDGEACVTAKPGGVRVSDIRGRELTLGQPDRPADPACPLGAVRTACDRTFLA